MLWTKEEKGMNARHMDNCWSLWNILDLTPEGRGATFYPKIEYEKPANDDKEEENTAKKSKGRRKNSKSSKKKR